MSTINDEDDDDFIYGSVSDGKGNGTGGVRMNESDAKRIAVDKTDDSTSLRPVAAAAATDVQITRNNAIDSQIGEDKQKNRNADQELQQEQEQEQVQEQDQDQDQEEEEEEDEDDDDDVNVTMDPTPTAPRTYKLNNAVSGTTPNAIRQVGGESAATSASVTSSTSAVSAARKLDINIVGEYNGAPVYDYDLDELEDKPWRKPGADISDYFNYGFTEETWRLYAVKQQQIRSEAQNLKKNSINPSSAASLSSPFGNLIKHSNSGIQQLPYISQQKRPSNMRHDTGIQVLGGNDDISRPVNANPNLIPISNADNTQSGWGQSYRGAPRPLFQQQGPHSMPMGNRHQSRTIGVMGTTDNVNFNVNNRGRSGPPSSSSRGGR